MTVSSPESNFKNASFGDNLSSYLTWLNSGLLELGSMGAYCRFDRPESNINYFVSSIVNVSNV